MGSGQPSVPANTIASVTHVIKKMALEAVQCFGRYISPVQYTDLKLANSWWNKSFKHNKRLWVGRPSLDSRKGRAFTCIVSLRLALGPSNLIQYIRRTLLLEVMSDGARSWWLNVDFNGWNTSYLYVQEQWSASIYLRICWSNRVAWRPAGWMTHHGRVGTDIRVGDPFFIEKVQKSSWL